MPNAQLANYLHTLKKNYESLSRAYRRGEFEEWVRFRPLEDGAAFPRQIGEFVQRYIWRQGEADYPAPFKEAARSLFEQARMNQDYTNKGLSREEEEQTAVYKLRALALSYEILDFFIKADAEVSRPFVEMAREVSKDARRYYEEHYSFVRTPAVKVDIVKQMVLAALCGVNSLYRRYDPTYFAAGLGHVDRLAAFLKGDFLTFCGRDRPPYGLLGLGHFLKGRLLLGGAHYGEADNCFRLSAEYYLKTLSERAGMPGGGGDAGGGGVAVRAPTAEPRAEAGGATSPGDGTAAVSVAELLAMRRAALALAFGSGYAALITSRVKEANNLLTLARGVLHFNSPKVYAYYTELLFWSTKRAENSNDRRVLEEARRRVEECREVFLQQVGDSHYPHRAGIELGLVLHYLAQLSPDEKPAYYETAVTYLEAAVEFARGDAGRKPNRPLLSEASYILSHILRYRSMDLFQSDPEGAVALLKSAFGHARAAEKAAAHIPRHKCEAILALCGVYAEAMKRGVPLSTLDPKHDDGRGPGRLLTEKVLEAMRINAGSNLRVSAICHLRLVDHYLEDSDTYSLAYRHWEEWDKIRHSVEHRFVKDWAERTALKLKRIEEHSHVLDYDSEKDIDYFKRRLNVFLAKHKIEEWAREHHWEYHIAKDGEIKERRKGGAPGKTAQLKTGLSSFLEKALNESYENVKSLVEDDGLLAYAEGLMRDHISLTEAQRHSAESPAQSGQRPPRARTRRPPNPNS